MSETVMNEKKEAFALPTQKSKPLATNPKFMILYGKPKSGKTTILSGLDGCLIIDLEEGTDYVEAMSVKVHSMAELREVAAKIKEAGCPYKYIAIDTATKLEDMCLEFAKDLYRNTPMGKSWAGDDVRKLPNGSGYLYLREAFKKTIEGFRGLTENLILVGHCADKLINKDGKELSEMELDLTGKLKRIMSAEADAIGYVYRKKNETIVNFKGGEDFIVEARPLHLRGQEIVVAESDEDNNISFNWDKIYV
jgi:hypothetical protein